jgi:hypothetical protein
VEKLFGGGDDLADSWQQLTIVPTTTALLEETKERALLSIQKKQVLPLNLGHSVHG